MKNAIKKITRLIQFLEILFIFFIYGDSQLEHFIN